MTKNVNALATLAVAGTAFAQSSVTLSGGISASYQKAVGGTANVSRTDAFMKLAATEDLGGGLKVSADVSMDFGKRGTTEGGSTAPATTNSGLSISSASLGTLAYANVAAGSARLSGGESGPTDLNGLLGGDLAVSQVKYTLPTLVNGLTLAVDATDGDTVDNATPITYTIGYAYGPASVTWDHRDSDKRQRLALSYDAGVAKFGLTTDIKADDENEFSVTVPMGALTLGMHYVSEKVQTNIGNASGTAVSANYALSKRTSVLGSVFNMKSDAAAYNGNGYRVRLLHTF